MWVIGFPTNIVDVEVVEELWSNRFLNEAHEDVIIEDLRG